MLTEKALSGRAAWVRLFEEQTAAVRVELPGADEPVTLDAALAKLFSPDREERRTVAERVTAALEPGLRTRAYAFNTLLADKMVDDRLRSYPHWLAARNLDNEASDESVAALIEAVRGRFELARRWYRLKAATRCVTACLAAHGAARAGGASGISASRDPETEGCSRAPLLPVNLVGGGASALPVPRDSPCGRGRKDVN